MDDPWNGYVLFAQAGGESKAATEQPAPDAATGQRPPGPGIGDFLLLFAPLIFLFYLFIIRPEQTRNRKKQELLSNLKKNDKVLTIGGIYGVVANVKSGSDEILIKIDDDKDVKMRVTKASISQVITQETEENN